MACIIGSGPDYRREVSLRLPAERQLAVACGPYTAAQWAPSRRVPAPPDPGRWALARHRLGISPFESKPGTSGHYGPFHAVTSPTGTQVRSLAEAIAPHSHSDC